MFVIVVFGVVDAGVHPEDSVRELRNSSQQPVSKAEWVRPVPCCSAASKGARSRPFIGCFGDRRLDIINLENAIACDRGGAV
jgi:hypothetical protein